MDAPRTARPPHQLSETAVRSVTLLGATGSVGSSTVDLLKRNPDRFQVEAVSANRNARALAKLALELNARFAVVSDPAAFQELKDALAGTKIEAGAGESALIDAAERPAEWVLAAIVGSAGLKSSLAAARRGATVALANKECLVCAGDLFMQTVADAGAQVLPVDSEHNAIYQALKAGRREDVSRILLTASGGPFRTWTLEAMRAATREQAMRHPNWSMGAKITIDSATMMNKGLELIEAHHLFDIEAARLDVVVHPQSIVHGLVEYVDGSVVAQLSAHDMRIPIAYCLAWPERIDGPVPRLDLATIATLTFEQPDPIRFPALAITRRALEIGGAAPTVLNAANEVAVDAFLHDRIGFTGIVGTVMATLDAAERRETLKAPKNIEEALAVDNMARSLAQDLLREIAAKAS